MDHEHAEEEVTEKGTSQILETTTSKTGIPQKKELIW
jgi:hypothetical protein